jgi:hypothetical protein
VVLPFPVPDGLAWVAVLLLNPKSTESSKRGSALTHVILPTEFLEAVPLTLHGQWVRVAFIQLTSRFSEAKLSWDLLLRTGITVAKVIALSLGSFLAHSRQGVTGSWSAICKVPFLLGHRGSAPYAFLSLCLH